MVLLLVIDNFLNESREVDKFNKNFIFLIIQLCKFGNLILWFNNFDSSWHFINLVLCTYVFYCKIISDILALFKSFMEMNIHWWHCRYCKCLSNIHFFFSLTNRTLISFSEQRFASLESNFPMSLATMSGHVTLFWSVRL